MTTWFTSDLHLGHKNIIKYCRRPFAADVTKPTKAEILYMDEMLVDNWNSVVAKDDIVWNLGDAAFCCPADHVWECLARLNGQHHLLAGNHDEVATVLWYQQLAEPDGTLDCLASFREGHHMIVVEGQEIFLSHYANRQWLHAESGAWHLFGHTHGALRPFGKSVDVGVDNTYEVLSPGAKGGMPIFLGPGGLIAHQALYRPVSFEEVKAFMDKQPMGDHPMFSGAHVQGGTK